MRFSFLKVYKTDILCVSVGCVCVMARVGARIQPSPTWFDIPLREGTPPHHGRPDEVDGARGTGEPLVDAVGELRDVPGRWFLRSRTGRFLLLLPLDRFENRHDPHGRCGFDFIGDIALPQVFQSLQELGFRFFVLFGHRVTVS